jgi:hypothetical protein
MAEAGLLNAQVEDLWWQNPAVHADFKKTLLHYREYREMVMCEKCLKLDSQFDAVASLLKTYRKGYFGIDAEPLICLCSLLENAIPGNRKKNLVRTIDKIGFEKIQKAFQDLMRACDKELHEEEDLFFILKKHRLNFPKPGSDKEKLYRIGQFLNVALINRSLMKAKGGYKYSEKLLKVKYEASVVIMPLLDELFLAVFGKEALS